MRRRKLKDKKEDHQIGTPVTKPLSNKIESTKKREKNWPILKNNKKNDELRYII